MHVHLTRAEAVPGLLELLDSRGVERAVVLGTQDALAGRGSGKGMEGHEQGNAIALAAAIAHPQRLLAFAALDLESDTVETIDAWLEAGGCGFKIPQGDRRLHVQALDSPAYAPLWARMAASGAPVLMHVNTTRFESELDALLDAHPQLNAVCAHWCSSRTDLDRFERIATAHPKLRFDTSSGGAGPSAAGTASLSAERERARELIARWPERFVFGSDLVTQQPPKWRVEWQQQLDMDRDFLTEAQARVWIPTPEGALTIESIPALALSPELAGPVLADNARAWLSPCLE